MRNPFIKSSDGTLVCFGVGAEPIKKQFPHLTKNFSANVQKSADAVQALSDFGYLSESAQKTVREKIANVIGRELRRISESMKRK